VTARLLAAIIIVTALFSGAAPALAQTGFDRPGGDYTSFSNRNGDPAVCAARCEGDKRCRAWSFSYPRTDRITAMCWLKNEVPPRVDRTCCISGVRGAGVIEPRSGTTEYSTDRYGGDYKNFEVSPDPTGGVCKTACEDDKRCRAWTYSRQGYFSGAPRCYLKDRIKPPRRKPCCISGVVR
jgi:hypothetical protein